MTAQAPEAVRAEALDRSGWGERFRLLQPRNACLWLFVLGVAGGAAGMLKYAAAGPYRTAFVAGTFLFALYAVPWWLYLTHLNRFRKVPGGAILTGFVWGFFGATFWIAIKANDALLQIYAKLGGQEFASEWGAALAAPFTEELAKGCGLILLLGLASRVVRSAFDGFILGAFIGLGFQISEDILYAVNGAGASFGSDQLGSALQVAGIRGASGLFSHTMFSAIYCAGLVWLLGRDQAAHRTRGALLMLFAMLLHFTWDSGGAYLSAVGIAPALNYPLTIAAGVIGIRWLLRVVRREEFGWVRDVLAPEVEAGVLTRAEVDALAGRGPRRHFVREQPGPARRAAKHVLKAAEDLVEELASARGADTDRVRFARAEIARLRAVPAAVA